MVTGTIERLVSHSEMENFDFATLFDEKAVENDWTEEEYAAAARMSAITAYRNATAEECSIYFTVDGIEYGVDGLFVLEGSGALSHIILDPMDICVNGGGAGTLPPLPDALFTLLTPALEAIAGEAW